MGVSKNNGTPKSSILIGFSIINHPFWGTPIFGNTHIVLSFPLDSRYPRSHRDNLRPDDSLTKPNTETSEPDVRGVKVCQFETVT